MEYDAPEDRKNSYLNAFRNSIAPKLPNKVQQNDKQHTKSKEAGNPLRGRTVILIAAAFDVILIIKKQSFPVNMDFFFL